VLILLLGFLGSILTLCNPFFSGPYSFSPCLFCFFSFSFILPFMYLIHTTIIIIQYRFLLYTSILFLCTLSRVLHVRFSFFSCSPPIACILLVPLHFSSSRFGNHNRISMKENIKRKTKRYHSDDLLIF